MFSPRGLGSELLCIKILFEADVHNNQSTDENKVAINTQQAVEQPQQLPQVPMVAQIPPSAPTTATVTA